MARIFLDRSQTSKHIKNTKKRSRRLKYRSGHPKQIQINVNCIFSYMFIHFHICSHILHILIIHFACISTSCLAIFVYFRYIRIFLDWRLKIEDFYRTCFAILQAIGNYSSHEARKFLQEWPSESMVWRIARKFWRNLKSSIFNPEIFEYTRIFLSTTFILNVFKMVVL